MQDAVESLDPRGGGHPTPQPLRRPLLLLAVLLYVADVAFRRIRLGEEPGVPAIDSRR